jgi:uncharacterized protein (TIGR03435 family)
MKLALAILAIAAPLTVAQSPTQPVSPPTCASATGAVFDVASVKPSQLDSHSSHMHGAADSFTASASVFRIVEYAYDLHDFQVIGGPDWIRTTAWDVVAKVDQPPANYDSLSNDARGATQQQRAQAVLAQRFNLKCHFETRQLPVYNLVLAKGGPKPALAPTPDDAKKKGFLNTEGRNRSNRMEANGLPIQSLASALVWPLGRTVIDKTGLTGLYDFTLTYTSDADAGSPASDAASGPTIFTALEEQLGLKLESAKGPVPVIVIDSIDPPSEN